MQKGLFIPFAYCHNLFFPHYKQHTSLSKMSILHCANKASYISSISMYKLLKAHIHTFTFHLHWLSIQRIWAVYWIISLCVLSISLRSQNISQHISFLLSIIVMLNCQVNLPLVINYCTCHSLLFLSSVIVITHYCHWHAKAVTLIKLSSFKITNRLSTPSTLSQPLGQYSHYINSCLQNQLK